MTENRLTLQEKRIFNWNEYVVDHLIGYAQNPDMDSISMKKLITLATGDLFFVHYLPGHPNIFENDDEIHDVFLYENLIETKQMMQNIANWKEICKIRCVLHDDELEIFNKRVEKATANRQALCTEFVKIIKDEERLAGFTVRYCNGEVTVLFPDDVSEKRVRSRKFKVPVSKTFKSVISKKTSKHKYKNRK